MTFPYSLDDTHIDDLLRLLIQAGGTELRLAVGRPPLIIETAAERPVSVDALLPAQAKHLCYDVLTDAQIAEYEAQGELRFVYSLPRCGQFETHFRQVGTCPEATFRRLSES